MPKGAAELRATAVLLRATKSVPDMRDLWFSAILDGLLPEVADERYCHMLHALGVFVSWGEELERVDFDIMSGLAQILDHFAENLEQGVRHG